MKRFFEELKAEMTERKDQLAKKMRYFKYIPILLWWAVMGGVTALPAYADTIASSKIGTGLTKLIQDATSFLMVVAPVAMVVMLIYFFIRKGMADEMDQKKWNSRVVTAIVSCVGAFVASVIINLATSYFQ